MELNTQSVWSREPEQTSAPELAPPSPVKKSMSLKAIMGIIASSIIVLGLVVGLILVLRNQQVLTQELSKTKETLKTRSSELDALKKQESINRTSFERFAQGYTDMLGSTISGDTSVEKTAIEAAIKAHYKLSVLPEGWRVLTIFELARPLTSPTGELRALIYWPASDTKPAGFFEMLRPVKGSWQYNDAT
ncbi:MAG: hypothetical protein WBB39_04765 [Candidatus Saccharimonadales bacterium]